MKSFLKKLTFSRPWIQLLLVFSLICLLRFFPFFFENKALVFGDNYSLMVPGKLFTVHWLRKGILPLWNPTILGGIPWIGDVNQSVLYPSTLIFAFFKPAAALNLTVILHLFLTFLGTYLTARRWLKSKKNHFFALIAAILWTLSTQITGSINNLSTIQSLAWMPWVVYFGLGVTKSFRSKLCFAIIILFQFAGGYPQHVIYSILTAVFLDILISWNKLKFWLWFKNWFLTAVFSIAFSAIIWLPFVGVLSNSTRMLQSYSQAEVGSLSPAMLIKMVLPYFFDRPAAGYRWGPAWSGQPNSLFYLSWFGLGVLIFGFKKKSKQDLILAAFVVASLAFSLGKNLPGFTVLQKLIPLLRIGRYPSMVLISTNFVLALWISGKIEKLKIKKKLWKRTLITIMLSLIITGGIYLLAKKDFSQFWSWLDRLLAQKISLSSFHTMARDRVIAVNIIENLLVALVSTFLILWSWKQKRKFLILSILVIEMVYATQSMLLFAPSQVYSIKKPIFEKKDPQARWLTRNSNHPYTDYGSFWEALVVRSPFSDSFVDGDQMKTYNHLENLKKGLTPDWNMPLNYSLIHGYTTLLPQDYAEIWAKSSQTRINFIDQIDLSSQRDQILLKEWAVKYYLVDNWFNIDGNFSNYEKLEEKERWSLYQLPAFPRFRYFDGIKKNEAPLNLKIEENPNKIILDFDNQDGAEYLIVADRYDKNWQAIVNGNQINIENQKGLRKIKIMPGVNHLAMVYHPRLFYIGQAVSLLTGFVATTIILLKNKIST